MHSIFTPIYISNHGSKDGPSPLRKKRVIPVSGWSEEFHPFLWRRRRAFHQHPASRTKNCSQCPSDWLNWLSQWMRAAGSESERVLWRLRHKELALAQGRIHVLFWRRGRPVSEKDRPAIGASTKVCERAQECACVSQNWNTKIFFLCTLDHCFAHCVRWTHVFGARSVSKCCRDSMLAFSHCVHLHFAPFGTKWSVLFARRATHTIIIKRVMPAAQTHLQI